MPDLDSLNPDQHLALRSAATNLRAHFAGTFSPETIELFLETSYDQFAERAKFTHFLPLIAERFAPAPHRPGPPRGQGDECAHRVVPVRAQRGSVPDGTGLVQPARRRPGHRLVGGSEPSSEINPSVVEAMREVGIDIAGEYPKPWTDEILRAADVVVTMGCGDACPIFPGKRYEDWQLDDPAGRGLDEVRPIRDAIGGRVRGLLASLDLQACDDELHAD